jgi:hypothetical protein
MTYRWWNLITHRVNQLRRFGREGPVGHQPINRVRKRARGREELDTDKITIVGIMRCAEVPDARVGHCRLAVEHQADRLDGLDGERLVGLDECALVREIAHANRVAGVEGSPERSEHFESNPASSIPRRPHHRSLPIVFPHLCKAVTTTGYPFFIGKTLTPPPIT